MIQNESMTCATLAGLGLHAPYYAGSSDLTCPHEFYEATLGHNPVNVHLARRARKAPMYLRYVTLHAY